MSSLPKEDSPTLVLLNQIQKTLQTIQQDYRGLSAAVERIDGRVNVLSGIRELQTQERQPVYNTAKKLNTVRTGMTTALSKVLRSYNPDGVHLHA